MLTLFRIFSKLLLHNCGMDIYKKVCESAPSAKRYKSAETKNPVQLLFAQGVK